jgi:excisionase family DNA binding protein
MSTLALNDQGMAGKALLGAEAAARYLGIPKRTLTELAKAGKVPFLHLPGRGARPRVMFSIVELDKWIAARIQGAVHG